MGKHRFYKLIVTLVLLTRYNPNLHAQQNANTSDSIKSKELKEIVVTGTRTKVGFLQSPVSLEKMDLNDIHQSAQR